jgi:hypothetical protein
MMTMNPLWPEIQSQLLPGQSVFDIPGVVNRSFHGRLEKPKVFLRQNFAYETGAIEQDGAIGWIPSSWPSFRTPMRISSCTTRSVVHVHSQDHLRLLDSHIYVDVCTSMVFFYLYKYLFQ